MNILPLLLFLPLCLGISLAITAAKEEGASNIMVKAFKTFFALSMIIFIGCVILFGLSKYL